MQSVINVLINRATRHETSVYTEATRAWQFSSMTATGDPNLKLFPIELDPQWLEALDLMSRADSLEDLTDNATFYYAASMETAPKWAADMLFTKEIAGQFFYREA